MRKFLFGLFLCVGVVLTSCTTDETPIFGDVYGIISDTKSGSPIRNAEITISPGNSTTVSGSDGHFEFKSLEAGQYKISVTADGYSSNSRQVTIVAGQSVSCDIHLTPQNNDVVMITPTSLDFGINELQLATTITNESDSETEWFLDLGDTPWLYAYPTTGRIGGGKHHTIVFTANRARMKEDKSSIVKVSAFGDDTPLSIKCKQSVQLSSVMVVESLNVDFGEEATEQIIRIRNISETDVNWTLWGNDSGYLTMSATHGIVAPGSSQIVTISLNREELNEVLATTFKISDGTVDQPVNVIAYPTPEEVASTYFELTTNALDFGEQAETLTLTLLNVGVNSFSWKIADVEHPDVVTCSPNNGSLDGGAYTDITVSLNRSAMAEGAFESSFVVTDGVNSQGVIISATHTNTRNKIFYTSIDGTIVEPNNPSAFGVNIVSNTYEDGRGVITFDGEIKTIGSSVFEGCHNLVSVTIPDGVTSIGESAFASCWELTSINIPDSVTTIGNLAFAVCNVTSVTIPESVTSIGYGAFQSCANLSNFNGKYATTDGKALICDNKLIAFAPAGMTSYIIPEGVTTIGILTFVSYSNLTSVTLPKELTTIEDDVFNCCSGLTSINIPDGVTSIGAGAFNGCSGLTSIDIPDGVTSIGEGAFSGCSGLTSIIIPDVITSIESSVFSGCSGLTSIDIPDGVTSIGEGAFSGCSGLTSIDIPDVITSIESSVFSGCSGLTSIDIPDGVTSIGNSAFSGCSGLTSIDIPDGVTSIGNSAFSGCSGLTSIDIPDGVTSIGNSAFSGCSSLTSITIPDGVTSIGGGTFGSCTSLTSITIPDSVTSIGNIAFNSCSGLTSITIPDGVTSIGEWAFNSCSSLASVYCRPTTPPTLGTCAFPNATQQIYTPTASVDAYKAAEGWSDYADAIVGYDF